MAVQYNRTCDVGQARDEFLRQNPHIKFADLARAAIDAEMKKARVE